MRRAVLGVVALLIGGAAACTPHEWHGTPLDPPPDAPGLALTTANGRAVDLANERGNVVLVFFGYANCPDVCPTALADWARAKRALGADTTGVRFLFVSVDPARDTPAAADAYAKRFDPAFVGASGTPGEVGVVLSAWGIGATPEGAPAGAPDRGTHPHAAHGGAHGADDATPAAATIAHTARTFLVDPDGRLRLLYGPQTRPDGLAADVRALLD